MKYIIILFALIISSCAQKSNDKPEEKNETDTTSSKYQIIEEDVLSNWDENDNIDSPAFYQGLNGENWIIATAKSTDRLFVYDAVTGEVIQTVGEEGTELGQMDRPNGIWVYEDICYVVERDNHRVQMFSLPSFEPIGQFGSEQLIKPYGISVVELFLDKKIAGKHHKVFITDNYEYEEDVIPADSLLGKRVLEFNVFIGSNGEQNHLRSEFVKNIGPTSGDGVLKVVESVLADTDNNKLYICEELEGAGNTCIKIFDLEGNYQRSLGLDIFQSQAEGLAIIDCGPGKGNGYLITTDQSYDANIFHFFDRKTLELKGSFQPSKVSNTDGIWLTQNSFGDYTNGQFIAVNNDGGIGAWSLKTLMSKLDLMCD